MNRTATAALTAALTTGLLTAVAGTAQAFMPPSHWYALVGQPNTYWSQARDGQVVDGVAYGKPLFYAEMNSCRAVVNPYDNRDANRTVTKRDAVIQDDNGYITVPVPAKFQGVRAVTVEVQVGTNTSALPKWMQRSAKPWMDLGSTVTTSKRFSAPLGGSVTVGIPNGAVWPDIPLASASVRVSFATGSATRFALDGGRAATGKCRGYGKTLGAVEHHELLNVNLTQKVWEAGNRLTRIKVG